MRKKGKLKVGDIVENNNNGRMYVFTRPDRCINYEVIELRRAGRGVRLKVLDVKPGNGDLVGQLWWCDDAGDFKLYSKYRHKYGGVA